MSKLTDKQKRMNKAIRYESRFLSHKMRSGAAFQDKVKIGYSAHRNSRNISKKLK